jgi:hypothetical protein
MAVDAKLLLQYRDATEALLDALTVFEAKIHTRDGAEYNRLEQLMDKCQADLDKVRRDIENARKT